MVLSLDKADVWERRADQRLEPGMDYRTALGQARDGTFDPRARLFDKTRPPDRVYGQKLPVGRVEWVLPERPRIHSPCRSPRSSSRACGPVLSAAMHELPFLHGTALVVIAASGRVPDAAPPKG